MTPDTILDGDNAPATYALAIHGGAGTVDAAALGADGRDAHHHALQTILAAGRQALLRANVRSMWSSGRWWRSKTAHCSMPATAPA